MNLADPASTGSRMVDQLIREREECKAAWKRAEAERDVEYRKYAQEADRAEALEAEVTVLRATVDRVRKLVFRRYTGSPSFDKTPEGVREIDALADLYDERFAADLRAALDGGGQQ